MRQRLVAANWKMHGDRAFARQLMGQLKTSLSALDKEAQVVIIPPAQLLADVSDLAKGSSIEVGAQNLAQWESGAFTGEISAEMLADVGARYALVGHSERRSLFAENDDVVAAKVARVLATEMKVIFCCGESLAQRESGSAQAVVDAQLAAGLREVSSGQWGKVIVAYEPVWAIGTGKTASPEDAQEIHAGIRVALKRLGAPEDDVPVIYGGSVKESNARELFAQPDVDGGLVGGASLDAQAFAAICRAV
ncbi:triose-phosphate isomerase [Mangrovitalea sediminis]|uniref:triose-phosphate isomerase n=1 Tax=Mangrovitalea sediminis TaxID=1982043 RepID=UPI000BE4CEAA|nr:triose-phosphate isomerase [Mangrovitalea sediminis]